MFYSESFNVFIKRLFLAAITKLVIKFYEMAKNVSKKRAKKQVPSRGGGVTIGENRIHQCDKEILRK
jgi:hypothetical protein